MRSTRILLALVAHLFATLCLAVVAQAVAEEQATFHVHPNRTFQTIEGFGGGVYQRTLEEIQTVAPEHHERLFQLLYGDDGVRLNIIRIHISWHAVRLPSDSPLRAKGLVYNWEEDEHTQNVLTVVKQALQYTDLTIYAVPFTPPTQWKTNQQYNFGGSLLRSHYDDYAAYLADFVVYYKLVHNLHIDVLSVQNEPDVKVFWESCRWTGEELRDFLKILGPVFRARGLPTRIMVSEGSTWDQAWIKLEPSLHDPEARSHIALLASHSYGWEDQVNRGRELLAEASRRYDIPLWMSEMSLLGIPEDSGMPAALSIAYYLYQDLVEAEATAWIYCFIIFNPEFPGSMGVLSPAEKGALVVPKRLWAMANYSQFIRPGWKRIQVDGLHFASTAFISPEGDRFVVVALNAILNERPATYDFGDWKVESVEAYRTSEESDLASAEVTQVSGHSFRATLAPRSITTFVGRLAPPAGYARTATGQSGAIRGD